MLTFWAMFARNAKEKSTEVMQLCQTNLNTKKQNEMGDDRYQEDWPFKGNGKQAEQLTPKGALAKYVKGHNLRNSLGNREPLGRFGATMNLNMQTITDVLNPVHEIMLLAYGTEYHVIILKHLEKMIQGLEQRNQAAMREN